ncbi:sulfotransferase [Alphaproteobacteria bacterium]|nr:sulfotransferase [Alphaproteobacteria bacterium]
MRNTIQGIIDAIKKQEYHNAENLCWSALKKQPNSSELNKWLGLCLLQQKKFAGGIKAFLKALPEKKNDFDVLNNLAFAYRNLDDYANAIKYLDKAEKIIPNQYAVRFNRAQIFFNLKKFDQALELAKECFTLIKSSSEGAYASDNTLQNFYIEIQLARNEVDEATNIMMERLHKEFDAKVFYNLSNSAPEKIDGKIKKQAQNFALDKNEFFMNRSAAFLGLGRICEKEKKVQYAFEHYAIGNKIKAEKLRFKPFLAQEKVKENIKYFKRNSYEEMYKNFGDDYKERGSNIIFVIGSPRSGTTLVESILGSSEKINSAGELSILPRLSPKSFENLTAEKIQHIGDEYLRILKNFNEDGRYDFVIDKMPSNIYQVGLIKICFPSAKIVCLNRRPLDNAWSIFTQLYLGNIPYSSDLFNLGVELSNVEALKKVWISQNDSKNFLLVDYEEIVNDPHKYAKELYNFIGIEGTYDEEKRKAFSSRTASKTQVKKDIYTSSVSRSKEYDVFLGVFQQSFDNQNKYWDKYLKDKKI